MAETAEQKSVHPVIGRSLFICFSVAGPNNASPGNRVAE